MYIAMVMPPVKSSKIPIITYGVPEPIVDEYNSHLLVKPLNGGIPVIDNIPIIAAKAVNGIYFESPPKTSRSLEPVL